ncbi:MAG TPA: helix-turn-helix transcriptional regulator [Thermoanaerobaculia bacterium]|nr:helix-turn-helix transcriptional regulator [Thermoanaerobaculia bacterium]
MTEHEKARAWRQSLGLSQKKLGELLGYSIETISWFEKGMTPPRLHETDRRIKPWIWRRYHLACRGLAAEMKNPRWDWDHEREAV